MRLLVVDAEPSARADLTNLCQRTRQLEVVGEADSGVSAIRAAQTLRPDLMLLDVALPDMTGFDVLRIARAERRTLAIMVTAHAEHAVTAFAAGALDFLLKPVSSDRFSESIERARERFEAATASVLIGERERRLYPLDPEKIDYIEADGNYVTFRVRNVEYISRDSIKRLSGVLAAHGFVRIERSVLLNVRSVAYAEPIGRGSFAFTLTSGACVCSSATYREAILTVLPLAQSSARCPA